MMLWKNSVGESKVDCSRVDNNSLIEEGVLTRRFKVSGLKTQRSSTGRRAELARPSLALGNYIIHWESSSGHEVGRPLLVASGPVPFALQCVVACVHQSSLWSPAVCCCLCPSVFPLVPAVLLPVSTSPSSGPCSVVACVHQSFLWSLQCSCLCPPVLALVPAV